jgi:hypothetical protein
MRATVALVAVALLGIAAAPAEATLLVKSDGTDGLVVMDKNGLNDVASMTQATVGGAPGYLIRNFNFTDFFDFDFQSGCSDGGDRKALCKRFISKMNIALAGGNDTFDVGLVPTGTSSVAGGSGNDNVDGHGGTDNLNGGTGDDELQGFGGSDTLNGRDGADELEGGRGVDTMNGDEGNDTVNSKEPDGATAERDTVSCGTGQDFVVADLKDSVSATSNPGGGTCEEVDRSPVGETPHVRLPAQALRASRRGKVKVRLRCPRGVKRLGCKGRLQLRVGRAARAGRSRRVRYKIKAGRRKTVTLRLTRRDVRGIRRRGRRARGILISVERGRLGRKTTIRNPRLKLR